MLLSVSLNVDCREDVVALLRDDSGRPGDAADDQRVGDALAWHGRTRVRRAVEDQPDGDRALCRVVVVLAGDVGALRAALGARADTAIASAATASTTRRQRSSWFVSSLPFLVPIPVRRRVVAVEAPDGSAGAAGDDVVRSNVVDVVGGEELAITSVGRTWPCPLRSPRSRPIVLKLSFVDTSSPAICVMRTVEPRICETFRPGTRT